MVNCTYQYIYVPSAVMTIGIYTVCSHHNRVKDNPTHSWVSCYSYWFWCVDACKNIIRLIWSHPIDCGGDRMCDYDRLCADQRRVQGFSTSNVLQALGWNNRVEHCVEVIGTLVEYSACRTRDSEASTEVRVRDAPVVEPRSNTCVHSIVNCGTVCDHAPSIHVRASAHMASYHIWYRYISVARFLAAAGRARWCVRCQEHVHVLVFTCSHAVSWIKLYVQTSGGHA